MTRARSASRRPGGAGPAGAGSAQVTPPLAGADVPAPAGRAGPCWVVMRRRVSLAGHVWRGADLPASSGAVHLTPSAPEAPGAAASPGAPLCHAAPIRPDGRYVFMDLPAGDYAVTGHAGAGRRQQALQGRTVAVPAAERRQPPLLIAFDLVVEPGPPAPAARDGLG